MRVERELAEAHPLQGREGSDSESFDEEEGDSGVVANNSSAAPAAKGEGVKSGYPVGIKSTQMGRKYRYGALFEQQVESSNGKSADLEGVIVGEEVSIEKDDFGFNNRGVKLGEITADLSSDGKFNDKIKTKASKVKHAMHTISALPAVLRTPQKMYWLNFLRQDWQYFASVDLVFTVREESGKLVAETIDNGVTVVQDYKGPVPQWYKKKKKAE